MHTRTTTAAVILAAGLTLTGCSSSNHPDKPATTPPPATSAASPAVPTTASKATLIEACVAAITAGKDNTASGAPECNSLPRPDYLEAIHEANEAGQKAFDDATDAGASATP